MARPSVQLSPGNFGPPQIFQPTIQIYVDLTLKNSTKQPVNEETTVGEIIKSLKQMFGGNTSTQTVGQNVAKQGGTLA